MRILLMTIVAGISFILPCAAGIFSHGCPKCGCRDVQKICRVIPDVKKVTETKFVVECAEICLPGKSRHEQRPVPDNCAPGRQRMESVCIPTCDRIVTKKTLKKITTTVDKPGFKCVVETVCGQCGGSCGQ